MERKQRETNPEFHSALSRVAQGMAHEWNRFMLALDTGARGLEKLASFAEEAMENEREKKAEQQEPWHNASDDLLTCMENGHARVQIDERERIILVFGFLDPNGNSVAVDYLITNENEMKAVRKVIEKGKTDKSFPLIQNLIGIIGQRW